MRDFPTPPFPLTTAITFFTEEFLCGSFNKLSALRELQLEAQLEQLCEQFSDFSAIFSILLFDTKKRAFMNSASFAIYTRQGKTAGQPQRFTEDFNTVLDEISHSKSGLYYSRLVYPYYTPLSHFCQHSFQKKSTKTFFTKLTNKYPLKILDFF
jgi:phage-related protein